MLTELLAFLDELLSYLESVRDVRGEEGSPARRSPEIERLTQKTRALRDAVSAELQKHWREAAHLRQIKLTHYPGGLPLVRVVAFG
jgi:hypothetical protein